MPQFVRSLSSLVWALSSLCYLVNHGPIIRDRKFDPVEMLLGYRDPDQIRFELLDQPMPQTNATFLQRRLLILGDALIGKPPGSLSLLPDGKFEDSALARQGVSRLTELDVDVVLVGDGASILKGGGKAIRRFVASG